MDAGRLKGMRRRCQGGGREDLLGQTVLVTITHGLERVWLMRYPKGRFGSQASGEIGSIAWCDGEVESQLALSGKVLLDPVWCDQLTT